MSENFIIDTMQWSFSRLETYNTCPCGFKRTYIDCEDKEGNFFAAYGSHMHSILEKYAKNEIGIWDMPLYYEENFNAAIPYDAPPNKYTDIKYSYFTKGQDYLDNFSDTWLEPYNIIAVEQEVHFAIYDKPFIGFIDLLLQDKETDELTILDHKSASLKWKKNGDVSKSSEEKLKKYKYQLYLYSKYFIDNGQKVSFLRWNFFNDQKDYVIVWDENEYHEAIQWAEDTIREIEKDETWFPNPDFYFCNYICDHGKYCEYRP